MKKFQIVFLLIFLSSCGRDPLTKDTTPIYTLPSITSTLITTLPKNTHVDLSFQVDTWCRILYQDITGYTPCINLDLPEVVEGRLSGKTVIVDPGHGGRDNGAIVNGVREKDINRAVSEYLIEDLKAEGANVIVTRMGDEYWYLYDRPTLANLVVLVKTYLNTIDSAEKESIGNLIDSLEQILQEGATTVPYIYRKGDDMNEDLKMIFELTNRIDDTVFLSIHSNVTGESMVELEGLDIILSGNSLASMYPGYDLYNEEKRLLLGNLLGEEIPESVPIDLRRVYFGDYAVLREENLPSVLIELGYMDNEEDLALLTDPAIQKEYARGITNAVIRYFEESKEVE
ncbi:MAG: N-acetylmuramoyl-L-alanine amidase [Erysipelotrichales bacterium]|nr:N-acetylmuramoyl-L-alanine amidase [Erysipelotrichales bacterium]